MLRDGDLRSQRRFRYTGAAMKTHAIRIYEYGGPEVLRYEEVDLPEPGPGEARIRHTAIGLNYIDT